MPHTNKKATVRVFDIVYLRAEYWRKAFCQSRSEFYKDALHIYCNNLGGWYPDLEAGEVDCLNNRGKDKPREGGE